MIFAVGLLVIGFIFLIKGADFFVDGASSIAAMFKVPPLVIGLTIVAMGTSLPELSVSAIASLNNSNSLAISNAVGSNIFNFMIVLGITAIIMGRVEVEKEALKRDFPISILCAGIVVFEGLFFKEISRAGAIIHLIIFTAYILIVVISALKNRSDVDEDNVEILPIWKCIIFIIGGAVAIKFGGDWVVEGAVAIAERMGLSETLIGLTIVSMGTSLPELVTSMVAAKKGELEMAVGNAVGSNVFNLLFILGVAGTISPIETIHENIIDAAILIVFSIIVFVFCAVKKHLPRYMGVLMILGYAGYMVYIITR